jgi:hypothetical protein
MLMGFLDILTLVENYSNNVTQFSALSINLSVTV